jgi:hypothetical protein
MKRVRDIIPNSGSHRPPPPEDDVVAENGVFRAAIPAKLFHPVLFRVEPARQALLDICRRFGSFRLEDTRLVFEGQSTRGWGLRLLLRELAEQHDTLPYVVFPLRLPDDEEAFSVIAEFMRSLGDPYAGYDIRSRCLIVPLAAKGAAAAFCAEFNLKFQPPRDEEECCCCLWICDDPERPVLTRYPLSLFEEDGSVTTRRMCKVCVLESLRNATATFFDGKEIDRAKMKLLREKPAAIAVADANENERHEVWPQAPLGAMMLALLREGPEMKAAVEAWIGGVSWFTLRTSPALTACPEHPESFFVLDTLNENRTFHCRVLNCYLARCRRCKQWHQKDVPCEAQLNLKCPKCQVVTWKDGGCNHITCPCGCHWCYVCGKGYRTGHEVYEHMSREHGDWWD